MVIKPTYLHSMNTYYVYEDWTTEEHPRCFYVGKGTLTRVQNLRRNAKHTSHCRNFGLKRVIVLETHDETLAFNREIFMWEWA